MRTRPKKSRRAKRLNKQYCCANADGSHRLTNYGESVLKKTFCIPEPTRRNEKMKKLRRKIPPEIIKAFQSEFCAVYALN